MTRALVTLVIGLLVTPAFVHAQQSTEDARRAELRARRDSLETEVVHKWVRRLSRDLELTDDQRSRVDSVMQRSGVERRALSRASSQLRGALYRATRNDTAADAEFVRLLTEYDALRSREHELWRREQAELAAILSPRQRSQFLLAWARFQDDMREILSRRMRELDGDRDRDRDRDGRDDKDRHSHRLDSPDCLP